MKITEVRLFQVRGTMEFPGEFWEERLIRPIDVYPEHKAEGPAWLEKLEEGKYRMQSTFVEIVTDEGVNGIGGPGSLAHALLLSTQIDRRRFRAPPTAHPRARDTHRPRCVQGRQR